MQDIVAYIIRTILLFIFTYFGTRLLSKKAISQMTTYEFAGIMLISNVASEPLTDKVVTKTALGVGLLILLIAITSRMALINKLTPIFEHTPTIIIRNGQIVKAALKENALTLNELYGIIRQQGYNNITDIEVAILEPHGVVSVIPKSQKRPVQPSDLKIPTQYEGFTLPLIMDGSIIEKNLQHANITSSWLMEELKKQGINDEKDVVLVELDTSGNLRISR